MLRSVCLAVVFLCNCLTAVAADSDPDQGSALFDAAKDKVLKVRVVLKTTQSQAAVGSGFLVSEDGLVVTNFHVVSAFLRRPADYTVEFARNDGSRGPLTLLNVDIVHDLALLQMDADKQPHFQLVSRRMWKGERGFSIGNPHDLGLTIVEGTYNGFIAESQYEHIHFTGAINPGMSGGPALTREGTVFGVNVARLVNAEMVSFLIPAKFVRALIDAGRDQAPTPESLLLRARDQLLAEQDANFSSILDARFPQNAIGPYQAPAGLGHFMRCWGSTESGQNRKYRSYVQSCLSEESIFVFDNVRTGSIDFDHLLLESRGMHPLRFYKLFESRFGTTGRMAGSEEDFTEFRCNTEFVSNAGLPLRTALCVRAYKRLPGLYDFWLRAATLNQWDKGLMTTLWVAGVSYGNGRRFVERYLDALSAEGTSPAKDARRPAAKN